MKKQESKVEDVKGIDMRIQIYPSELTLKDTAVKISFSSTEELILIKETEIEAEVKLTIEEALLLTKAIPQLISGLPIETV